MVVTLVIIGYLACSILTYGITFGYFQREFKCIAKELKTPDSTFALGFSLLGPIGLVLSFILSGYCKHGLKYK